MSYIDIDTTISKDPNDFAGQGNYSQVHKAQWQGKLVAVKTILPQSDHGSTLIFEVVQRVLCIALYSLLISI